MKPLVMQCDHHKRNIIYPPVKQRQGLFFGVCLAPTIYLIALVYHDYYHELLVSIAGLSCWSQLPVSNLSSRLEVDPHQLVSKAVHGSTRKLQEFTFVWRTEGKEVGAFE